MNRVKSTVAYKEGDKTTIIFYGYLLNREQIESAINAAIHADETRIEAERCENCRFLRGLETEPTNQFMYGYCHVRSMFDQFPSRKLDDWCGEWQPKTD